jgi:hypothetical protein
MHRRKRIADKTTKAHHILYLKPKNEEKLIISPRAAGIIADQSVSRFAFPLFHLVKTILSHQNLILDSPVAGSSSELRICTNYSVATMLIASQTHFLQLVQSCNLSFIRSRSD